MGMAWPCGTDGPAGGRLTGSARDAQTRGHYFCSEPLTAPHSRPLIKPRRVAPPTPPTAGCEAPVSAPPGAPPLPAGRAEGSAAHPEPGAQLGARSAPRTLPPAPGVQGSKWSMPLT